VAGAAALMLVTGIRQLKKKKKKESQKLEEHCHVRSLFLKTIDETSVLWYKNNSAGSNQTL